MKNESQVALVAECLDAKGTKSVQQTADAGLVLLKNFFGELVSAKRHTNNNSLEASPSVVRPSEFVSQLEQFALKAIESHESRIEGKLVVVSLAVNWPMSCP